MATDIFSFISGFLKKIEGYEGVDICLGRLEIDDVTATAQLIAKEKGWFDQKDKSVKADSCLVRYEFSKKLVWFIYFIFTQEELQKENLKSSWVAFAVVRIDDETGEVLFADFIKQHFVQE